jgi:uncharacterized protein
VKQILRVVNSRRDKELGSRIALANGWLSRLRGMIGARAPQPGEGLLLTPCSSVHMYGMRFPLDVAFLDRAGKVVAMYPSLAPQSRTRWHRDAAHALELPAGTLGESGTTLGDVLVWSPASATALGVSRTEALI